MSIDAANIQHEAHVIEEASTHGSNAAVEALRAEDQLIRRTEGSNTVAANNHAQAVMAQMEKDGFLDVFKFDVLKEAGDISGHDSTTVRDMYNPSCSGGSCHSYVGRGIQHVSKADVEKIFPTNSSTLEGLLSDKILETVSFNDCGGHDIRKDQRPTVPEVKIEPAKKADVHDKEQEREKEPTIKDVLAALEKLQAENVELRKELAAQKSGKSAEPSKPDETKGKEANKEDEKHADQAKRLAEAKKLIEEENKKEEARQKEEEAARKRQEAEKEAAKNDHAKQLAEAKKLIEEENKKEDAKRKEEEGAKKKPEEGKKKDAPDQPKEELKKKDAPDQPKVEPKKKDAPDQPKDETISFRGRDAENMKSITVHRNEKGDVVSKEYEFNRPWPDLHLETCKSKAVVSFNDKNQEEKIVHTYDNGWVYTSYPTETDHGHVYVQRPVCTRDEDPKTFDRNAKEFGTIDLRRSNADKIETFALTKPLLVDGYKQLDLTAISGLPGGFRTYKRFGEW